MLTVDQYVAWALSTLVSAFIGSYVAGYLKKKGETIASKEDIKDLVEQVSVVTEATKRIEAEISIGVWNKQKRWEMKREVLFDAAKRLSEVEDTLLSFATVMRVDQAKQKDWASVAPSAEAQEVWLDRWAEITTRWTKASTTFEESRVFVGIVCGKDARQAFEDLGKFITKLAAQMTKDPDAYQTSILDLVTKVLVAQNAIRKELEVDT